MEVEVVKSTVSEKILVLKSSERDIADILTLDTGKLPSLGEYPLHWELLLTTTTLFVYLHPRPRLHLHCVAMRGCQTARVH